MEVSAPQRRSTSPKLTKDRPPPALFVFAVLSHRHFDGAIKRAHRVLVQNLSLFPPVRYHKVVERLHRY